MNLALGITMKGELTVSKTVCCVAVLILVVFTITEYNETWKLPFQLNPVLQNTSYFEKISQGAENQSVLESSTTTVTSEPVSDRTLTRGQQTVFVLAFYRTGSTLTASVLASYPGAFYVFEPWYYIGQSLVKKRMRFATYANGTKRQITDEFLEQLKQDELHAWATCQLRGLPLDQFRDISHTAHSDSLKQYRTCFLGRNVESCFDKVEAECRKAPIRVVKFIRARMEHIAHMVTQYPHLQFIHLLRDPRGNALSQISLSQDKNIVNTSATRYCDTERKDIAEKHRIFSSYPQRIYTIQYENLAEQPLKYTSEMLHFVDNSLELMPSMEAFIREIAIDGSGKSCAYCVDRGNGSKVAQEWRQKISWDAVTQINTICGDIIDIMGYKMFESEKELKDMSIPYRIDQDTVY